MVTCPQPQPLKTKKMLDICWSDARWQYKLVAVHAHETKTNVTTSGNRNRST